MEHSKQSLRAVTLQKHSTFRVQEHGSTISCFKYNLLQPFERVIWKFPFDIAYKPGVRVDKQQLLSEQLPYLVYGYARHPRTPNRTPTETFDFIYRTFRKYGKRWKKPGIYTLFDYFHDFRVWANYLDIDNLLSLRGSGYKSFIDQNLSVILFFIGGIAELCYIAVFGARRYAAQLQSFYDLFAVNNPELESDFVNTSIYQRLLIYNELHIIDEHIKLKRHFNMNAINLSST